jgi:threonine dehydrogenase-like Zn-dependent dehydrogenase
MLGCGRCRACRRGAPIHTPLSPVAERDPFFSSRPDFEFFDLLDAGNRVT